MLQGTLGSEGWIVMGREKEAAPKGQPYNSELLLLLALKFQADCLRKLRSFDREVLAQELQTQPFDVSNLAES